MIIYQVLIGLYTKKKRGGGCTSPQYPMLPIIMYYITIYVMLVS